MPFRGIYTFNDINVFHQTAGGKVRSIHPDVHLFRFEDLGDQVVRDMPLFRQSFYSFGLLRQSTFSIDYFDTGYRLENRNALVMLKPGQLIQWQVNENMKGYVLLIRDETLGMVHEHPQLLRDFPFLAAVGTSFQEISDEEFNMLAELYEKMLYEYGQPLHSSLPVIRLYAQILMHKICDVFRRLEVGKNDVIPLGLSGRKVEISTHFLQLLDQQIENVKSVAEFSELLHISPKYLSEAVNAVTGQNPKEHINQKILLLTKTLLKNTQCSVSRIAEQYHFKEQGHFSKFFREHTGMSPLSYRNTFRD